MRPRRANYFQRYVPDHPRAMPSSGCVYTHVVIAEQALGRFLPAGACVHHVDENHRNNTRSNLVICQDAAYHKLLHVRTRVLKAGGNPNTQRICSVCRTIKAFSEFNNRSTNRNAGLQTSCRQCQSTYQSTYERTRVKGYTKQPAIKTIRYYCGMCDRWFTRGGDCPACGAKLDRGAK